MELKAIQENLSKLNFPKEQQNALLHLVDVRIDNDMDKVLNKIDSKFDGINAKFDSFKFELKHLEDKQDSKFDAMDTKFAMIMWALGILIALILALKFIH